MSIVPDQRKRTTNQQRPHVAAAAATAQQNSNTTIKKNNNNNKEQNRQTHNQLQPSKQSSPPASSQAAAQGPRSPPPPPTQPEKHEPLPAFNAADIDALLSSGIDVDAEVYKPGKLAAQKNGPWGQKPGTMASGKDFWIELRRQVTALQKGESTNKGG